ncbi:MAG: hypothetical protein V1668_04770 [Patescibacteria group bacterium]
MKLSHLQKFILKASANGKSKTKRAALLKYYDKQGKDVKPADRPGILTKSVERLIEKGLMIGYGRRTPEKWFIDEVSLTLKGAREAKKLFGLQQRLPLQGMKIKKSEMQKQVQHDKVKK